ncbi:cytidylate kinase-like family protein [Ructibacterium gallinarum]|uniref:Cytidylate kinase-like family protein n=1 Tax=Ructibacterium gallinarum TaxID=2779355 RepID=A0A9D5LYI6_9FIRM|nr:cytidylate kinase-like family protein [Ructibacterium gallinarum]MBE5040351.1 cytidylate kinase-like family protein [Ructibacterium gallinarum]
MSQNKIITIARQFGSGGRDVAKKVSELMGTAFYDKELIAIAAKESGLSETLFDGIEEKPTNSLLYSLVMGIQSGRGTYYRYGDVLNSDGIFRIQSQVIRNLAEEHSCVIVGRCSDYILREQKRLVNVFVHADLEWRVRRVMELYQMKEKEAENLITKTDKRRSSFYNFYTNKVWGNADNYHISLDTSKISIDQTAELIVSYANMAMGE